jgi:hypothetical protein
MPVHSEFYQAVEAAANPIMTVVYELPRRFRKKYINEKELLTAELININEERVQFTNLKEKVLAQLGFINTVLEVPSSIGYN